MTPLQALASTDSKRAQPDRWPIAAAMLQFPARLPDGSLVQDQPAEGWAEALAEVANAGFDCVDPTDSWLRVGDLSPQRLAQFQDCVSAAGLSVPAISTSRRSVVDPQHGGEYLEYGHRLLDAAATLGAGVVSFGFMQALTPAQQEALWFWTAPGARDRDDIDSRRLAVSRIRELAEHGAQVGVKISLEMYEDTYLGTADGAVRFLSEVNHSNAGLNPDLGNLVRLQGPVEPWLEMAQKTVPLANYWHVKNYFRAEVAGTNHVVTIPAPLEVGVMNYRALLKLALQNNYTGPFCVEHYGGDGLSVCARNRDYLHGLLPAGPSVDTVES